MLFPDWKGLRGIWKSCKCHYLFSSSFSVAACNPQTPPHTAHQVWGCGWCGCWFRHSTSLSFVAASPISVTGVLTFRLQRSFVISHFNIIDDRFAFIFGKSSEDFCWFLEVMYLFCSFLVVQLPMLLLHLRADFPVASLLFISTIMLPSHRHSGGRWTLYGFIFGHPCSKKIIWEMVFRGQLYLALVLGRI